MAATTMVRKETFTITMVAALPVGLAQILNGVGDNVMEGSGHEDIAMVSSIFSRAEITTERAMPFQKQRPLDSTKAVTSDRWHQQSFRRLTLRLP